MHIKYWFTFWVLFIALVVVTSVSCVKLNKAANQVKDRDELLQYQNSLVKKQGEVIGDQKELIEVQKELLEKYQELVKKLVTESSRKRNLV